MSKTQVTTKIWKDTLDLLRDVRGRTSESVSQLVHRLAAAELYRLVVADEEPCRHCKHLRRLHTANGVGCSACKCPVFVGGEQ